MRSKFCLGLLCLFALTLIIQHGQHPASPVPQPVKESTVSLSPFEAIGDELPGRPTFLQSLKQNLDALAAAPDEEEGAGALEQLADTLADAELPAVLNRLVVLLDDEPAAQLRRLLLRRWAGRDPGQAAAWARALPEGPLRGEALEDVAIIWAGVDLAAAMQWVRQSPDSDSKQAALLDLGYEAARAEPFEAIGLAGELRPGRQRDQFLDHAVRQWAAIDPSAASEWAGQISDAERRERILVVAV